MFLKLDLLYFHLWSSLTSEFIINRVQFRSEPLPNIWFSKADIGQKKAREVIYQEENVKSDGCVSMLNGNVLLRNIVKKVSGGIKDEYIRETHKICYMS